MNRSIRITVPFGLALFALVACGDNNTSESLAPLDLGGGISMTADGGILGATPPRPSEPDFLSATTQDWQQWQERTLEAPRAQTQARAPSTE